MANRKVNFHPFIDGRGRSSIREVTAEEKGTVPPDCISRGMCRVSRGGLDGTAVLDINASVW
jgi:hypothetical protein